MPIVVAVPAVDTEVLHSFGASEDNRAKNCLDVNRKGDFCKKLEFFDTHSTGKSLMWMSPMEVWMMALSDTLLGPSACVAAITSSFEGFSLKMSLSESALFVSSGSLFENLN